MSPEASKWVKEPNLICKMVRRPCPYGVSTNRRLCQSIRQIIGPDVQATLHVAAISVKCRLFISRFHRLAGTYALLADTNSAFGTSVTNLTSRKPALGTGLNRTVTRY